MQTVAVVHRDIVAVGDFHFHLYTYPVLSVH